MWTFCWLCGHFSASSYISGEIVLSMAVCNVIQCIGKDVLKWRHALYHLNVSIPMSSGFPVSWKIGVIGLCVRAHVYVTVTHLYECFREERAANGGFTSWELWTASWNQLLWTEARPLWSALILSAAGKKEPPKQTSSVALWVGSKEHFCLWMIQAWPDRLRMQ